MIYYVRIVFRVKLYHEALPKDKGGDANENWIYRCRKSRL